MAEAADSDRQQAALVVAVGSGQAATVDDQAVMVDSGRAATVDDPAVMAEDPAVMVEDLAATVDDPAVMAGSGPAAATPADQVVTVDGLPVMSSFQSIPAGATAVTISENGQVTVQSAGGTQSFRLTLTRFANPSGLRSLGGNLYEETGGSGTPEIGQASEQGFGSIIQGYKEASNVNIVEEMVNLIVAQRAYESNSKSIQTSDEMLQNVANMKR